MAAVSGRACGTAAAVLAWCRQPELSLTRCAEHPRGLSDARCTMAVTRTVVGRTPWQRAQHAPRASGPRLVRLTLAPTRSLGLPCRPCPPLPSLACPPPPQDVAEGLGRQARALLLRPRVMAMDTYPVAQLPEEAAVVFVTSTTGQVGKGWPGPGGATAEVLVAELGREGQHAVARHGGAQVLLGSIVLRTHPVALAGCILLSVLLRVGAGRGGPATTLLPNRSAHDVPGRLLP